MVTERKSPLEHIYLMGFLPSWDPTSGVVPDWLNASRGTESHNRVVDLIEELKQLGMAFNKALALGGAVSSRQPEGVKRALEDLDKRHVAMNQNLRRYSFTPAVSRVWLGREWRLAAYSSPTEGQFHFERKVHRKDKTSELNVEHLVTEADAVLYVLILAMGGELDRVKQCENCFSWFYAERTNKKYCSGTGCRDKKYSSLPRYKNYRKLYMRRRRAAEKAAAEKMQKGTRVRKRR